MGVKVGLTQDVDWQPKESPGGGTSIWCMKMNHDEGERLGCNVLSYNQSWPGINF